MDIASGSAPNFLEPPFHAQAPPLVRFEGDGYDFRRPIMSTSPAGPSNHAAMPVIDLTDEESDIVTPSFVNSRQLPPLSFETNIRRQPPSSNNIPFLGLSGRGGRNTPIDLDRLPETAGSSRRNMERDTPRAVRNTDTSDSDDSDVVFVSEREVAAANNNSDTRASGQESGRRPAAATTTAAAGPLTPARFHPLGNLGEIFSNNTLNFFQFNRFSSLGFGPVLRPATLTAGYPFGLEHPRPNHAGNHQQDEVEVMTDRPVRPARRTNFPLQMDFEAQGFELYEGAEDPEIMYEGAVRRGGRQESPPYKAPSAPPDGFTRKIEEETMVMCPNCNEELGRREYDDLKKQVWVVKACGHVYCGECTKNRFVTKGKSAAKHTTSTFKQCVVDGCDKMVYGKTAMLQIYL